jgi:hypothetical protein
MLSACRAWFGMASRGPNRTSWDAAGADRHLRRQAPSWVRPGPVSSRSGRSPTGTTIRPKQPRTAACRPPRSTGFSRGYFALGRGFRPRRAGCAATARLSAGGQPAAAAAGARVEGSGSSGVSGESARSLLLEVPERLADQRRPDEGGTLPRLQDHSPGDTACQRPTL